MKNNSIAIKYEIEKETRKFQLCFLNQETTASCCELLAKQIEVRQILTQNPLIQIPASFPTDSQFTGHDEVFASQLIENLPDALLKPSNEYEAETTYCSSPVLVPSSLSYDPSDKSRVSNSVTTPEDQILLNLNETSGKYEPLHSNFTCILGNDTKALESAKLDEKSKTTTVSSLTLPAPIQLNKKLKLKMTAGIIENLESSKAPRAKALSTKKSKKSPSIDQAQSSSTTLIKTSDSIGMVSSLTNSGQSNNLIEQLEPVKSTAEINTEPVLKCISDESKSLAGAEDSSEVHIDKIVKKRTFKKRAQNTIVISCEDLYDENFYKVFRKGSIVRGSKLSGKSAEKAVSKFFDAFNSLVLKRHQKQLEIEYQEYEEESTLTEKIKEILDDPMYSKFVGRVESVFGKQFFPN